MVTGDMSCAMEAGAYVIVRGEVGYAAEVGDTSRMNDRRPNVIDQLFGDKGVAVPDRIEHFAHSERRCSCASNAPP